MSDEPNLKLLTRDQILAADDFEYEVVDVPEWGGQVRVRSLSGAERDSVERRMVQVRGQSAELNLDAYSNFRAFLVSMSLVDGDGNKLFSTRDVEKLGEKSAKALQRVFNVASRLSAFTEEDVQELTEDIAENPTDGSSSDSA